MIARLVTIGRIVLIYSSRCNISLLWGVIASEQLFEIYSYAAVLDEYDCLDIVIFFIGCVEHRNQLLYLIRYLKCIGVKRM